MFAPVEGRLGATPWVQGKVRSARGGWRRLGKKETPSFANACWQVGAEPLEGCGGRSPLQCHSSPQGVCTHSCTHTRPARAPAAGTSAWFGGAERTPHPTSGSSPAGDAPHSPPPKSHWTEGWRGAQGARSEGGRPSLLAFCSAEAAPRLERSRRVEMRGQGSAPGAWPETAAAADLPRRVRAVRLREAAGREAAVGPVQAAGAQLLTGSAGWRAGVEAGAALGGVAAGDTLGCLEGAAGGGRRAEVALPQTCASGVTSCHRSHPGRTPLLSSLHFSLRCPPAPGAPACAPNESTSPARSEDAGASHEPFVLGPFRSALLSRSGKLAPQARPRFFCYLRAAEAAGERRGGPRGKRSCQDLATPGNGGPGAPGVPGPSAYRCAGLQTRSGAPPPPHPSA